MDLFYCHIFVVLKKSRYLLTAAWFLLFCFIAGQVVVYSHQHHALKHADISKNQKSYPHHTVAEKCMMCDSMHHNDMLQQPGQYICHLQPASFTYPVFLYNFKSFGMILADGLSPPHA